MPIRIEWDKFETALLIDACEQVLYHNQNKAEVVKRLSFDLRSRAVKNGIEIDDVFRNENGIALQMTKMDYLLTDGDTGLPGAGKIFTTIATIRKTDPEEYNRILKEANKQIKRTEINIFISQNNKERFRKWLSSHPSKALPPELVIIALDDASDYCLYHGFCKESFWCIQEKSVISTLAAKLSGIKLFRITHRKTALILDKAVKLYKEFLIEYNKQTEESKIGNEDIVRSNRDVRQIKPLELSFNKTLEYLKTRYSMQQVYKVSDDAGVDVLYKFTKKQQEVMWVNYTDYKESHHICIATEFVYLQNIEHYYGFTDIQRRDISPQQTMFFEDYEAIKRTLVYICDSIDKYIAQLNTQPKQDYTSLYDKLLSISKVYDDPEGLTIEKILSLLGKGADRDDVESILRKVPWVERISDGMYSFARKREPKASITSNDTKSVTNGSVITYEEFYNYIHDVLGEGETGCRMCASALRTAESFAKVKKYYPYRIYNTNVPDALAVMQLLLSDADFKMFDSAQNNRYSDAFKRFSEFVNISIEEQEEKRVLSDDLQSTTDQNDNGKNKLIQTLLRRYPNGMQFDSIDFENFRETYQTFFGESLPFNDDELEERLRHCGIYYKDRLFPAEGIIDEDTKEKLFTYIDSSFASGKTVLYYKAIFEDLSDAFISCYTLTDEDMLRAYIEFTAETGKYYFFSDYMSKEKDVSINHTSEVEEYLLSAGKPISTEEVCNALSHIPRDKVSRIITSDNRFLRNAKGEFFHVGIFEVTNAELERIAEIINEYIQQNEYAIWTDVWNKVQETMPVFLENNLYLSWLGIRNALAQRFSGRYNFEGAVISMPKDRYTMRDIYQLYALHHAVFTADDIYYLSKQLDTVIYFDALAEVSIRVNHDLFVSRDRIHFDVEAVDSAIGSFVSKDYIRIRDIDSYLVFPNVEYEWNEYLLESFVHLYSEKYMLLNNGFSLHNVAGAVVKRTGSIKDFVDACAAVLADAPISLNKNDALNYLAEVNMITRRSYRDLDLAIKKAVQIRARKG